MSWAVPDFQWKVFDVTAWATDANEPSGYREKRWLMDSTRGRWLLKFPRKSRPYEAIIEPLAALLAQRIGIGAPETQSCLYGRQKAIAIRSFLGADETLTHGSELLGRYRPGYDPERKELHSLKIVRDCFEAVRRTTSIDLWPQFLRLLTFDAWVGNGDRHQQNWGLISHRDGGVRLAPAYDTAACLGCELPDEALEDTWPDERIQSYVARCPSGFGDGARLISQADLVGALVTQDDWRAVWAALRPIIVDSYGQLGGYLCTIPASWLPSNRARWMRQMLEARLRWLSDIAA